MTPLVMMNNIRSPNFPKVPLLTEVGYNGPPSRSWYGIFAPAGTPRPVVDRVSKDIGEIVNKPEFRDRHLTARSLVPAANTPEQFAEDMKRERVRRREGGQGRGLRAAVAFSSRLLRPHPEESTREASASRRAGSLARGPPFEPRPSAAPPERPTRLRHLDQNLRQPLRHVDHHVVPARHS